jgi:hypothetical protein
MLARRIEQLESIGYAAGSRAGSGLEGVRVHDAARACSGLNLNTSGHGPGATLTDMDGRVVHEWRRTYDSIWPDHPLEERRLAAEYWRRARLWENGDVVAVFEGLGIVRLTSQSEVVWENRNGAHHDFDVLPSGDLLVLTRTAHVVPRVSPENPILEDYLSVLDADTGEEKSRISLLECWERSTEPTTWPEAYFEFWGKEHRRNAADSGPSDIFHTNAVEVLDGRLADRAPAFAKGNVLVSMRNLDAIAVVDLHRRQVVWAVAGAFSLQHEPTVAPDGRILVFDNHWEPNTRSAVVAVDPVTRHVVPVHTEADDRPFYSHSCGSVAVLPNGNVLVTESDNGRAFELSGDGEIVWEFYNPHRAGDRGEYVATLFEVVRLPPDFPTGWAAAGTASPGS